MINRNKIGPAHYNSLGGRSNISKIQANDAAGLQISPAMKDKLKAVAEDADMPASARRVIPNVLVDRNRFRRLALTRRLSQKKPVVNVNE